MKYLSSILLLCILLASSCDGRDRANYTQKEKIEQSKLSKSFFEHIKYIPETYTEIETDTLLVNNFQIHLKVYSDMNTSILKEIKKDTIVHKTYYRHFKGNLVVSLDNNEIANISIDKLLFQDKTKKEFWKNATLGNIAVNHEYSNDHEILLNVYYQVPESNQYKDFNIFIDSQGKFRIEELSAQTL